MRCTRSLMVLLILSVFAVGGCGGSGDTTPIINKSAQTRDVAPSADAATLQSLAQSVNALGIDLLGNDAVNTVVAPYTSALALEEIRIGAAGQTFSDLNGILHLSLPDAMVDSGFNSLDLSIAARLKNASLLGTASSIGSRAWLQDRYGYLLKYFDPLAQNFGLYPVVADFDQRLDFTQQGITDWAQGWTAVPVNAPGSKDTRLAVGEGLFLRASWLDPFDPALTTPGNFEDLAGNIYSMDFLRKQTSLGQTTGDGYTAMELPISGDLRFLLILPDEGRFGAVQGAMTPTKLAQITSAMTPGAVDLWLPKFSISVANDLPVGSGAIKLTADFSGIDGTSDLFVTSSRQYANIKIDESGVQGGAATLLALDDAHPETWTNPGDSGYGVTVYSYLGTTNMSIFSLPSVVVGRPFLFYVRDSVTGVVLLTGRVVNP
ncbi:serpin family protein [Geomesophilobacter sediminis]|uniref:Serpin domain-containing protein n=1 Tax=Geomesophilobacter sediminis TaxID=2798584 RepID=A0A8J7LVS1_9BACT|nr:serpin family protein [Geomesophilobacter sediminis]MBJ6725335.1 hypothetical protein [Geomesophilobacter sediminis]